MFSEFCSISALSCSFKFLVVVVVMVPSDYPISTQLQLWLFCCWGCGCCWAVTIVSKLRYLLYVWNVINNFRLQQGLFRLLHALWQLTTSLRTIAIDCFCHARLYTSTAAKTQLVIVSANPATRHLDKYKPERQRRFYRYYGL